MSLVFEMSDPTAILSLEEEFRQAEADFESQEKEVCDTDGERASESDSEQSQSLSHTDDDGEQSQYLYFLSQSQEFDTSIHDDSERAAIEGFKCTCQGDKPCYKFISTSNVIKYRSNCLELPKDELDLVILGQIHSHYVPPSPGHGTRSTSYKSRYFFHDKPICLKTFLFLHSIGDKRYRNLVDHYTRDCPEVKTRCHGNSRRSSYKAASITSVQEALQFIKNTASAMALPLPGRMPNFKDERFLLLPTDMTKVEVYRRYQKACVQDGKTPFSRSKFIELWLMHLPFISVTKPATDLCWNCQKHSGLIARSANLSESEKSARVVEAQHHLDLAVCQCTHYNSNVKKCEDEWTAHDERTAHDENNEYEGPMHFSFDYAQQVHYPCDALQPGPLFFKTARKCHLFGVACEPGHFQVNYLIDEAFSIGKGANATISMVHDFLENRAISVKKLYLQADNCIGQNKNNAFIHYLSWRVSTHKNEQISFSFMLAGHTKFAPDRYFGLVKRKYKHSHVATLSDIEGVVKLSTV